ncbi:hypothetical protein DRO59_06045 [Candidatus Bathyarchaeota archaeon]|nr:MAG: hypothetical protein DRO59_06045 [Candidatus Bathyarchaeota archaeon]
MRKKKVLELGLASAPKKKPSNGEEASSGGAVDVVAARIKEALLSNPNLKPQTWMEVVKGLELLLKYKGESDPDDLVELFEEKLKDFEQ